MYFCKVLLVPYTIATRQYRAYILYAISLLIHVAIFLFSLFVYTSIVLLLYCIAYIFCTTEMGKEMACIELGTLSK